MRAADLSELRAVFVFAFAGSAFATVGDVVVRIARLPQMLGALVAVLALGAGGFAIGYRTGARGRPVAAAIGTAAVLYALSTIAWIVTSKSHASGSSGAIAVAAFFSFGMGAACPTLGYSSGRRRRIAGGGAPGR
jgi:hypothetical protein